jgi:hypothetical protein
MESALNSIYSGIFVVSEDTKEIEEKRPRYYWVGNNDETSFDINRSVCMFAINSQLIDDGFSNSNSLYSAYSKDTKFKDEHRESYLCVIKNCKSIDEDCIAKRMTENLLRENLDMTMMLLTEYFMKSISNDEHKEVAVKILKLLSDYSYEELTPNSQVIAMAAIGVKDSDKVVSASLDLFASWANEESRKLLSKMTRPNTNWLGIKYDKIISSLDKYVLCQKN